ncbi:hypothetical protein M899_0059 [Bacteriovorax sp. BSW11_IV]|uniref:hypothetical protein n=1 Tax=Bacteriovorax sp. BSW11_IV TaxID=1353529 RepID=UPI000389F1EA|nr:hypothetical protein [Bacteriovorax sp. BSW11_IV]EQC42928.1 hypothetical protein M899_0059 [Bacteriovorax sp. BSW11_IV]
MKVSKFVLVALILSMNANAQLLQKKYGGLNDKPAEYLYIDNKTSVIVPFHKYDKFLSTQIGIATRPANHIFMNEKDEVIAYPYLIVPDSEYDSYLKKSAGIAGKKENHLFIEGKDVVVLKASEINTNPSFYPGIANQPANHVMIDGQEVVFVDKKKYLGFIAQYPGIPNLPENYVYIDKKIVVVVPMNIEDSKDHYSEPTRFDINDKSRDTVKEIPTFDSQPEKSRATIRK